MKLKRLEIEITKNCPLKCMHCSVPPSMDKQLPFSITKLSEILKDFFLLGGKEVIFTGGEPLEVNENYLLEAISASKGMLSLIYTSGFHSNFEKISNLKKVGLNGMCVTLHGFEDSHDRMTQVSGSYKETIKTIENLKKLEMFCRVHFVPTQLNYNDFEKIAEYAFNLGINDLKVFKLSSQGRAQDNWDRLNLDKKQWSYFIKKLLDMKHSYGEKLICGGLIPGFFESCSLGEKIAITSEGNIIPCLGLRNRKSQKQFWGNIFDENLSACWQKLQTAIENKTCICFSCDDNS